MADYYNDRDTFRWGLLIDTNTNSIVVNEGSGDVTVGLDQGKYFHHFDTNLASDYDSLASHIQSKLNNNGSLSYTYDVSYNPPTTGSWTSSEPVGLNFNASSTGFDLVFSSSNFTLPPEYIGWDRDRNSDASTSGNDLTSRFTVYGMWHPHRSADNHRRQFNSIQQSSDSGDESYSVKWDDPENRNNFYQDIDSPFVYNNRSTESTEREGNPIGDGDRNNALEDMWRDVNDGSEIIVSYNTKPGNPDITSGNTSGLYDIVRLEDGQQRRQFFDGVVTDLENSQGEQYNVQFRTRIIEKNWDH